MWDPNCWIPGCLGSPYFRKPLYRGYSLYSPAIYIYRGYVYMYIYIGAMYMYIYIHDIEIQSPGFLKHVHLVWSQICVTTQQKDCFW